MAEVALSSYSSGRSELVPMQYPAPRVLLADAHADTRALYEVWLTQRGFAVHHSASGGELLQVARFASPDVVVTELMLPDGGPSVIATLRADAATADAVLIVLTTQNVASLRDAALDAGADLYLLKPCGASRLGEVIASVSRARFDRLTPLRASRAAILRAAQRTFAIHERVRAAVASEPRAEVAVGRLRPARDA